MAESLLTSGIPLQSWVFSVSTSGVLVYQSAAKRTVQLTWRDRSGKPIGIVGESGDLGAVRLSPDRMTAAVNIVSSNGDEAIWL